MAINPPNFGIINQQAGQLILNARNVLQQILFFYDYLNSLGVTGLVDLGFSAADAQLLLTVYTHMASVVNVCFGEAYTGPALPFNFLAETIPLWAGQ